VQTSEAQRRTNNLLQNSKKKEHKIENVGSQVKFRQRSWESELRQKVVLKSTYLMQQHNFNILIQKEEQRFDKSKKEEIIPRYRFTLRPYHSNGKKNEEFGQRARDFEPLIHYVDEQEVIIQGIKMSRGVESVFVIRQKIVVLPKIEPTMAEGVLVAIKVRYSEPKFTLL
jgi:hypothetical protein